MKAQNLTRINRKISSFHHAMGVVEPATYDAYLEFVSDFDI